MGAEKMAGIQEQLPPKKEKKLLRILLTSLVVVGSLAVLIFGAVLANAQFYEGRVFPGIYAGNYHLGGLNSEQIKNLIENYNNRLSREGLTLAVSGLDGTERQVVVANMRGVGDMATELLRVDSVRLVEKAMGYGRKGNWWQNIYEPWRYRFFAPQFITADVIADNKGFLESLKASLSFLETPSRNANVKITVISPLEYRVLEEQAGGIFEYEKIFPRVKERLARLSFASVPAALERFKPLILQADAAAAAVNLPEIISYGNLGLNHIDSQTQKRYDWVIGPSDYAGWLEVAKDEKDNLVFGLSKEKVMAYLELLRVEVDRPPEDAKFTVENNKVKEFQASITGVVLNTERTFEALDRAFRERNYRPAEATKTVSLAMDIVEPNIKISDINMMGIKDLIGSGTSTFFDSHTNRIKNIAHAVKRLNGTLIQPGEEFSALKYAGPFTSENGFLPEEVIKGDRITKEIGGGMCQIGTTLFRMAMNSGMSITARRNHSLVVSYYADPYNHNPGTDATLYEPSLDLKFLNDTGNSLLLVTEIDYKKQLLTFSLWGTNDGRRGWYDRPVVLRWIPAGEPRMVESATLKPGEKKCQAAFRGAVAKFTYTRITPAGERIERIFDSYYRPLPQICFVGKELPPPPAPVCAEGEVCPETPAAPTE